MQPAQGRSYGISCQSERVLDRKLPDIGARTLVAWLVGSNKREPDREGTQQCLGVAAIDYLIAKVGVCLEMEEKLDVVSRSSEQARVCGVDFHSVLSRGSQRQVEGLLNRVARACSSRDSGASVGSGNVSSGGSLGCSSVGYVLLSPSARKVAGQDGGSIIPVVAQPPSGLYTSPVVVLDFRSLYPSMIIAYNMCYTTCLGTPPPGTLSDPGKLVDWLAGHELGARQLHSIPKSDWNSVRKHLLVTPSGCVFIDRKLRRGVLPTLLADVLAARFGVKETLKEAGQRLDTRLQRVLDARQFSLKMLANVSYGYTAAGYSGRMPCVQLADAIVGAGRATLEAAVEFVHQQEWGARVVYGDTDSMFVHLPGRSVTDAFSIGRTIVESVNMMNPPPVELELEHVYEKTLLVAKKMYCGMAVKKEGSRAVWDAKGIDSIRKGSCRFEAWAMENSIKALFMSSDDLTPVRQFLQQRVWGALWREEIPLQDLVFARKVRVNRKYKTPTPAAIVAEAREKVGGPKRMEGERIRYTVIMKPTGSRLRDSVVDPAVVLSRAAAAIRGGEGSSSPVRLNLQYYARLVLQGLERTLAFGASKEGGGSGERLPLRVWFDSVKRPAAGLKMIGPRMGTLDSFVTVCSSCGDACTSKTRLCSKCRSNRAQSTLRVLRRLMDAETALDDTTKACTACTLTVSADTRSRRALSGCCTASSCPVLAAKRDHALELLQANEAAKELGAVAKPHSEVLELLARVSTLDCF